MSNECPRREAPPEPSGAAGWVAVVLHGKPGVKARPSVRMSRRFARVTGRSACDSPLTRRTDECRTKGGFPKTPPHPSPCGATHLAERTKSV